MAENKESDMINVTSFNESAVMSGLGVHSTPNVGQDNKIDELSVTDETNVTDDSGVQLTPTSTKCNSQFNNYIMSILRTISKDINEQKSDSDVKFNKINSQFDKLSSDVSELKEHNKEVKSDFDKINTVILMK